VPVTAPRVGSFEAWRDMIGGILENAGVPDFMENANDVYLQADEDRMQWEAFLQALWKLYGSEPFTTGAVAARMTYPEGAALLDMMPDALAEAYHPKNKTFSQTLGQAFKKVDGRHFPGGWCIRQGRLANGYRQWVITYSEPSQVECKWNVDSSNTPPDSKTAPIRPESINSSGISGMFPYTYVQEKKLIHNPSDDTVICGSKKECAIVVVDIPLIPLVKPDEIDTPPNTESGGTAGVSTFHLHSTSALILIPPGCLKHPIESYAPRKYDPSIKCIVPGCGRPGAYGVGAGFPLCEGHYQAEMQRVRREGGRQP